jgi:muconolactone delta-isomerase
LGLQVRLPKEVAEVNARKEMARAIMAEGIMNREWKMLAVSGEYERRN